MHFEIGFMARPNPVEDLGDRSALAQNMQYNKVVSRIFKPGLERRIADQAGPLAGTRTIKHPRGIPTRTDEEENLTMSLGLSQGDVTQLGRSMRTTKGTISPRPLRRNSGERIPVSTNLGVMGDLQSSSHTKKTHATLSGDSLSPTQIIETHDPPALLTWNWKLRAGKELEMSIKSEKQKWAATQDGRAVHCECSCDREELPMVLSLQLAAGKCYTNSRVCQLQCTCCRKLQHYHCYGYAPETHVPEHYCYQCLLEDTHATLLGDMKSLAIFRRALWILYEKNPSSPADFAQKLR